MKATKSQTQKKEEVIQRIDKLDPNNNKNQPDKPMVKKQGDLKHDDAFEHRTSEELNPLLP
ncbi:MAG: hypothetical protein IPP32_05015 [Bacteroidetes bacterium]|nr:hypothetical protein [Bacteroidota bacterium]